jgi:hypothetical protein
VKQPEEPLRPAAVCRQLLSAMDASDGRRRKRKRDTTPDAIGLALKRELLLEITRADPDPDGFEPWLLHHLARLDDLGAARAMGRAILEEWQLACASPSFQAWLTRGAPSADR